MSHPVFAIVGHPNKGKSSIVATLAEDDDVAISPRPGTTTVRIAYSPWLHTDGACLTRDGEFTRLTATAPGEYRIGSEYVGIRSLTTGARC